MINDIFEAIKNRREKIFIELLIFNKNIVHLTDSSHNTPLHIAVRMEHETFILMLLRNGANVNAKNDNDETPVSLASAKIVSVFVSHFKNILGIRTENRLSISSYGKLVAIAEENYRRKDYYTAKIIHIEIYNLHKSTNYILAITSLIQAAKIQTDICQIAFEKYIESIGVADFCFENRLQTIQKLIQTTELDLTNAHKSIEKNNPALVPKKLVNDSTKVLKSYINNSKIIHLAHCTLLADLENKHLQRINQLVQLRYQSIRYRLQEIKTTNIPYYHQTFLQYEHNKLIFILFKFSEYLIPYYQAQQDYLQLLNFLSTILYHTNDNFFFVAKMYYWELLTIFSIYHIEQVLRDAAMSKNQEEMNYCLLYISTNLSKIKTSTNYVLACYQYLKQNQKRQEVLCELVKDIDANISYIDEISKGNDLQTQINSIKDSPIFDKEFSHTYIAPQKISAYYAPFFKESKEICYPTEKHGLIELRI